MRQTVIAVWIGAGIVLGGAVTYPLSALADGNVNNGKGIYEKHCVVCHGSEGKGDGPTGRLLRPPAADFTSATSRKKTDADLRQVIESGRPGTGMTAWKGQLTRAGITDVLAYLATLRK